MCVLSAYSGQDVRAADCNPFVKKGQSPFLTVSGNAKRPRLALPFCTGKTLCAVGEYGKMKFIGVHSEQQCHSKAVVKWCGNLPDERYCVPTQSQKRFQVSSHSEPVCRMTQYRNDPLSRATRASSPRGRARGASRRVLNSGLSGKSSPLYPIKKY